MIPEYHKEHLKTRANKNAMYSKKKNAMYSACFYIQLVLFWGGSFFSYFSLYFLKELQKEHMNVPENVGEMGNFLNENFFENLNK